MIIIDDCIAHWPQFGCSPSRRTLALSFTVIMLSLEHVRGTVEQGSEITYEVIYSHLSYVKHCSTTVTCCLPFKFCAVKMDYRLR